MDNFFKKALHSIQHSVTNRAMTYDEDIAHGVSRLFEKISQKWESGNFELRHEQLLFAYELALQTLHPQKPLALSLGCGEGKQEGFVVGMLSAQNILQKRKNKQAKFLFLTLNEDLVSQFKEALLYQENVSVRTITSVPNKHDHQSAGIYLCDFKTYMTMMLYQKEGASYALLKDLDNIFVDEFHAYLGSSNHIQSKTHTAVRDLNPMEKNHHIRVFSAYKILLEKVQTLWQEMPELIGHSAKRDEAMFNPHNITKEDRTLQHHLYESSQIQNSILGIDSFSEFVTLLDTLCNALSKKAGKDYYLHVKDNATIGYSCASSKTGAPLIGTVFNDTLLATLIALKHTKDLSSHTNHKELEFVYETYMHKETFEISPLEALQKSGVNKFLVASATLGGIKKQLDTLGFRTHFLQEEVCLDLEDSHVHVKVSQASSSTLTMQTLQHLVPTDILAFTSKSAALLQSMKPLLKKKYPEYELIDITHNINNPKNEEYEQKLLTLKDAIAHTPTKKRVLLIQGLGEGSNIFKITSKDAYSVTLVKLDIGSMDTITQTRYRLGTKGRTQGVFIHSLSLEHDTSSSLTCKEVTALQKAEDKAELLQSYQQAILEESNDRAISYIHKTIIKENFVENRREFLKTAAGLAGAAMISGVPTIAEAKKIINPDEFKKDFEYIRKNKTWYKDVPDAIIMADIEASINGNFTKEESTYGDTWMTQAFYSLKKRKFEEVWNFLMKHGELYADTQPVFYYLASHFETTESFRDGRKYSTSYIDRKKGVKRKENTPLSYFASGMFEYARKYIPAKYMYNPKDRNYDDSYKRNGRKQNYIESMLLKSIIYAAKGFEYSRKTDKTIDRYLDNYQLGDFDTKKEIIQNLRKDFESLNVDVNNRKENSGYNRSVVAAWSSFFLITHYQQEEKKEFGKYIQGEKVMLIYNNLEQPLKKFNGFALRGPPHFLPLA